MVVGAVAANGSPTNINAGHERFKGTEVERDVRARTRCRGFR